MSEKVEINIDGYVKLVPADQIQEGEMVQVTLPWQGEELEVGLAFSGGQFYAFRDICPHMYYPLSIGTLRGVRLECRGHGWSFDLKSGRAINPPIRKSLDLYPVKIIEGTIWIKLEN